MTTYTTADLDRLKGLVHGDKKEVLGTLFDDDTGDENISLFGGEKASGMIRLVRKFGMLTEGPDRGIGELWDEETVQGAESENAKEMVNSFMAREQKVRTAFRMFKDRFPSQIWHCCTRLCFADIATDHTKVRLLEELILIHEHAEKCHAEREMLPLLIENRRKGVGKPSMLTGGVSRQKRESETGRFYGTRRKTHLHEFAKFVKEVLPFLYGMEDSPRGTARPSRKLCTQAICSLLGVSRSFLYHRKVLGTPEGSSKNDVESIIDCTGVRMMQHRRNGYRVNLPPVQSLPEYECGCDTPCLAEVPTWTLVSEYDEFCKLSRELRPRHKENCFLINRLYNPLTNSCVKACNKALAALYNVSESLIADVRRVVDAMCSGNIENRSILKNGVGRFQYDRSHPINRLPDAVREKVENYLDFILRADPSSADDTRYCRVYSPEINTQEKLRNCLQKELGAEDSLYLELSASTVQRMVNDYLKSRNYSAICFTQSDHNACPRCKALQYAILQYSQESRALKLDLQHLSGRARPLEEADQGRIEMLPKLIETKRWQEIECLEEIRRHNERDKRIRGVLKKLSDHFCAVENRYRKAVLDKKVGVACGWRSFVDRASITHQDDMTKVDLPHFVVSASADITRWRFDVNAHVNAVTNDATVFSHEQGMGPKNASLIVEEILLEHVLNCWGESIKIIVSDNAAVGKNWLTTIALPQYMVDQGLAEIVIMIFLENNHGKWLADMLFGQFQTRRKRSTILGIDDMLDGFEAINRRNGKVRGFAINPLSSVDFCRVFDSLGYETSPPKEFGFSKRNIHFAAACSPGMKSKLPLDLQKLLAPMLPDDRGMVRISTEPSGKKAQCELPYEERFFDVPAAKVSHRGSKGRSSVQPARSSKSVSELSEGELSVPLVVPLNKSYMGSGHGVVSNRTAMHVGYNGIQFSKLDSCAELRQSSSHLIRRAWPRGIFKPFGELRYSDEPIRGVDSVKCAPLNWILRRPVSFFCEDELDWKARYPPRNLLNAKCRKGPRDPSPWIPTATYNEPPFPVIENTASWKAMKNLSARYTSIRESLHILHVLREVFRDMGDRDVVSDPWFQKKASVPSDNALLRYQKELQIYIEREIGHPKGVITLKKAFRDDLETRKKVERIVQERGGWDGNNVDIHKYLEDEIANSLFNNAEKRPGGLDRFIYIVEKDQERYTRELKLFQEKQKKYDIYRGIAPKMPQDCTRDL